MCAQGGAAGVTAHCLSLCACDSKGFHVSLSRNEGAAVRCINALFCKQPEWQFHLRMTKPNPSDEGRDACSGSHW